MFVLFAVILQSKRDTPLSKSVFVSKFVCANLALNEQLKY